MSSGPVGWPDRVPPPGVSGWEQAATSWLLDHCPADYRAYAAWRRHPVALAWVTVRHIQAQLAAMRGAWRDVRPELGPVLPPGSLSDVLGSLTQEGLRLRAALRSAELLLEALQVRAPINLR
ncbi:hypothetical protein K0651_10370 [Ornithinimicrobium sp. Arc0846-15]|uniref:hypothetical protein n=1 Tax=Ornithinimicrobium sp. INDO-MA30-4 TaxID=2908651 RepID=UPI001C680DB5|nr:hypothetical protein [Ornithinimicrobium sp. INDO-MA30-4]MBW8173446.1 hypothetical protein [Ornithinimicrobium laminariae]UJH71234.1 hypothetical protein L0A91_05370 [Ornithinimicrobium sp. INDO-MA30-4]